MNNIQIFINESSLHGQYTDYNLEDNIKNFLNMLKYINSQQFNPEIFTTRLFFNVSQALNDQHIGGILEKNFSLKKVFFDNIKNVSKWENERIHDLSANYVYEQEDYVGRSIAELAERKLQNNELREMLVNFPNSKFEDKVNIEVCKNNTCNILLNCSFDENSALSCFISHRLITLNQKYDVNFKYPPRDYQTILNNSGKFAITRYKNQKRKVYERIGYDELWTVDNLHFGKDAHIEVFHKITGEHLGTSPYDKIILETKYKENDRKLF